MLTSFHTEVYKCERDDERIEDSEDEQDMDDENVIREPVCTAVSKRGSMVRPIITHSNNYKCGVEYPSPVCVALLGALSLDT